MHGKGSKNLFYPVCYERLTLPKLILGLFLYAWVCRQCRGVHLKTVGSKEVDSDVQDPGPASTRGGWPRAELHYGSILQYASVYTISRAVRTTGEATEDPLKSQFLSSFRCKC